MKVQRLFENSRQALRAERDRQQQEERERRRFTQLAVTAAISFGALAVIATGALGYALYQKTLADEAVIETKASAFWNGLQLWNDPLRERDVATLWKLTQEDDDVRVAFVRRLANSRDLIAQFGFKPQPIARAIGLRWPDEAREIAEESVAHLASGQFDPKIAQPFELVSYTRALAALEQLLDRATLEAGTRRIASAINDLAGAPEFTDQQLWALAEMVGVFAVRFKTDSIEPASERLREIIGSAEPSGSAGWALSRAIEVMAPTLEAEERSRALQYLVPLLGQNTDSWAAKAAPRALTALLPKLDPSQLDTALSGVPPAIAKASRGDSSYLLTLVQVAEKLARMGDQTAIAAFRRALTRQFTRPNDRLQLAALARATVPLLAQFADGRETLTSVIAEFVLVPDDFGVGLDTQEIFTRRLRAQRELRQALVSLDDQSKGRPSQDVLQTLHREWTTEPPPSARVDPYRRAAQVRLMALLAPSLAPDSVSIALKDLLTMLPRTGDYLAREAISRALVGLAPKLSDAEREEALTAAKDALAKTGSTEEATAWAEAIAALLPDDPRAATAEIVEALKYPTATETPTVQLLEALATPWGEEHETIAGKMLSDQTVLDWLEKRLPEGHSLAEPPNAPADLQFESTDPGQG